MDRTCPNCHASLKFRRLRTSTIEYPRHSGHKLILAHCTVCNTALVPRDHPSELWAGLSFFVVLGAVVFLLQALDKWPAILASLLLLAIYGVGIFCFYKLCLKKEQRWQRFVRKESEWMRITDRQREISSPPSITRPTRSLTFDFRSYVKDMLIPVVFFVPLMIIIGLEISLSVTGFALVGIIYFFALFAGGLISSHFEMGSAWELLMRMYFLVISLLLSWAIHPWFFDTPFRL